MNYFSFLAFSDTNWASFSFLNNDYPLNEDFYNLEIVFFINLKIVPFTFVYRQMVTVDE